MDNVEGNNSNESGQQPKYNYNHWDALEIWRYLNKDAISPDSFIDMGFLYLIAASLERRVWLGPKEKPLFPNLFIVLVAEPGVGKGQVVGPVTEFLKHHKEQPRTGGPASHVALTPELVEKQKHNHSLQQELIAEALANGTLDTKGLEKSNAAQPKQLFRMASDAITFEKLVNVHAKSLKVHEYFDEAENKRKKYLHASIAFSLEEMSSLFKRKTEDVADYLLTAFDCKDYSYDTIGRGNDLVTRCCLNFFAGTTPGFLKKSFRGSLIEEGLSARITFVYEHGNRVNKYPKFNDLDATQKEYGAAILEHIRKLSMLYGRVHLEPEAEAYLNDYFSRDISEIRTNKNIKLIPWYARKNIHLPKLAMAVHFSRDLRMCLTLQDLLDAESILQYLEKSMHYALDFDGNNPLSGSIKNIIKFLKNHRTKAASRLEIWRAFVGDLRESDLDEALNYLVATNAVVVLDVKMPKGETVKMYTIV